MRTTRVSDVSDTLHYSGSLKSRNNNHNNNTQHTVAVIPVACCVHWWPCHQKLLAYLVEMCSVLAVFCYCSLSPTLGNTDGVHGALNVEPFSAVLVSMKQN
jgi:hypothetical protein